MIVFGLSRSFALSLAALAISGAADMFSVNIRTTTATLVTPSWLRGRVGAVESVFVGASNQLGAFESGSAAALLGTVPAVVAGGAVTILIALAWTRLFPGARLARPDGGPPPAGARRRNRMRRAPCPRGSSGPLGAVAVAARLSTQTLACHPDRPPAPGHGYP